MNDSSEPVYKVRLRIGNANRDGFFQRWLEFWGIQIVMGFYQRWLRELGGIQAGMV